MSVEVSIVVPTVEVLVARSNAALARRRYEVVIVDYNSQGGTHGVRASLAEGYPVELSALWIRPRA